MLPGMAMAGAGAAVPIVLRDLGRSVALPAQGGGSVALLARTPGSALSQLTTQGSTSTFYFVDSQSGVLTVTGPSGSGKQPGDIESFSVREAHPGAVNSPRDSVITVTYN